MISLKVVVMMVILFSISYYLYALPLDKNQKLVGILGAVSSVALIFTIYQAYMQYQYDSTSELVRFNVDYWEKILEQTSDELYTNWYGGDFGGLSIERHKEWSRIASNIEAINKLNGYSANGYDFSGNEGWRNIIFNWVHDPEFQMYWQTDVGDYDETTIDIINYFQNLTEEENAKLLEQERKKTRKNLGRKNSDDSVKF